MDMLSLDSIETEDKAGKVKSREIIHDEFNQRIAMLE